MTIDPVSVGAGALVGAVAADAYADVKERVQEASGSPAAIDAHLMQLHMIANCISLIEKYVREASQRNELTTDERVVQLPPSAGGYPNQDGYVLSQRGFKHVSLLTPAAQSIIVRTPIGLVTFAMTSGWNPLDLPNKSMLWVQGASAVDVLLRWGDSSLDMAGV